MIQQRCKKRSTKKVGISAAKKKNDSRVRCRNSGTGLFTCSSDSLGDELQRKKKRKKKRRRRVKDTHKRQLHVLIHCRRTFLLYKFFQHLLVEQNKTNLHKRKNTHNTHDTHARPAAAWGEEEILCRAFSSVRFWRQCS